MRCPRPIHRVGLVPLAAVGALSLALAACGQSSQLQSLPTTTLRNGAPQANGGSITTTPSSSSGSSAKVSGTADVAYAGSLQLLNEKVVGPAFMQATGAGYQGRGAGAIGLSKEIASGEISPNVFESIGAKPIESLEPRFTSWYAEVAASPIVVAYNPKSTYASQLSAIAKGTKPLSNLFTLMATPGFKLGRTDPNTDPQGQAFVEMVELAQSTLHLPAGTDTKILGSLGNPSEIFAETALEPRLQAGQLDAASAYLSQAVQLHLPYISLPTTINFGDPSLAAQYATATVKLSDGTTAHGVPLVVDITTIGKPVPASEAFVAYVLSSAGRSQLSSGGYTLVPEKILGNASAVPAPISAEVSSSSSGSASSSSSGSSNG